MLCVGREREGRGGCVVFRNKHLHVQHDFMMPRCCPTCPCDQLHRNTASVPLTVSQRRFQRIVSGTQPGAAPPLPSHFPRLLPRTPPSCQHSRTLSSCPIMEVHLIAPGLLERSCSWRATAQAASSLSKNFSCSNVSVRTHIPPSYACPRFSRLSRNHACTLATRSSVESAGKFSLLVHALFLSANTMTSRNELPVSVGNVSTSPLLVLEERIEDKHWQFVQQSVAVLVQVSRSSGTSAACLAVSGLARYLRERAAPDLPRFVRQGCDLPSQRATIGTSITSSLACGTRTSSAWTTGAWSSSLRHCRTSNPTSRGSTRASCRAPPTSSSSYNWSDARSSLALSVV